MSFNNAKKYFITAKAPTTLLALLQTHLPESADAKRVLDAGGVWFKKKRVLAHDTPVDKGDTVVAFTAPMQGIPYHLSPQHIYHETDDFLVVIKPAGVTTVPDRSNITYNLTFAVNHYLNSQGKPFLTQPISRLDYMVSGLTIFPKNKQAERQLFAEMAAKRIGKYYVARLRKQAKPPRCLRIQNKLGFTHKAQASDSGKTAHSLFLHRQSHSDYDEYGVVLITGRRHQIRVHARDYLGPLLGDSLYGTASREHGEPPIQLACVGLNFWLQGKRYRFRVEFEVCLGMGV